MGLLTLALQAALVLVIVITIRELLGLRRAVRLAQLALPDIDEVRRLEKSVRVAAAEVQGAADASMTKLEKLCVEAERRVSSAERNLKEPGPPDQPVEPELAPSEDLPKPGPRILSEAGRAKYDRVLHLAAQGLDVDSIAVEVDLTRAEVELMLGSAS